MFVVHLDASTEREGNARARAPGRSWSADRIWPSERIQTEKPVKVSYAGRGDPIKILTYSRNPKL